ncbi:uncharacterized protein, partial [Miscanthus floridulus]|uniref:uncharacterized protein n=1 Tax=Miscanthus floridulus TaxID=154761 RepID=UPI00345A9F64
NHGDDPTFFQGSTVASMTVVLPSVRVLSLSDVKLCLDAAVNLVKCFPRLERLYIKAQAVWLKDVSYLKCQKLIATLDIRVRKIVLVNYEGSKSHINFVKLFVSNYRVLESLRLELAVKNVSDVWIARQHKRLHIEKRASRGAQIDFVSPNISKRVKNVPPDDLLVAKQVHGLSTDPFQRFH